jgi:hypothetical protein
MSTSEAELIGACACEQEIQFCRKLAAELGFRQYAPTPLFEDNTGCIALAEHGHFAGRSKHIHLRWMFISDFIRDGILKLHQVPTTQQVADIGTKTDIGTLTLRLCLCLCFVPCFTSSSAWLKPVYAFTV